MGFLENIGGWEMVVLILLGLFIFGPDRLPRAISDGLRTVRKLRDMARTATTDLGREIGTPIELEDLHPKTFLRKHLLSEEDERILRRPLESIYSELRDVGTAVTDAATIDAAAPPWRPAADTAHQEPRQRRPHSFDADAT